MMKPLVFPMYLSFTLISNQKYLRKKNLPLNVSDVDLNVSRKKVFLPPYFITSSVAFEIR